MTATQLMPRQTVLVVDDAAENLELLGDMLMPHFQVRVANCGTRALAAAQKLPQPDLILLDILMPDMDGYQVLAALKAERATRDIPVIFVTSMDGPDAEERGLDLGAVDYIIRPLQRQVVLARVRTHLELKHARDLLKDQTLLLEAEIERRMADNQLVQDVSIRALAALAEVRDNETGHHLLRTQGYVRALAEQLRPHPRFTATLTAPYIEMLVKSAPLHDIGKVGVPDAVLHKPARLTDDEWSVMRTHARLGRDAIEHAERDLPRPVEFLAIAKEIANWHHERWDGTGYPDGLCGDAIPLSARIMAIADVFDALISRRVYKAGMTVDAAVAIIHAGRGTHFDPDLVDAFDQVLGQFVAIAERYSDEAAQAREGGDAFR